MDIQTENWITVGLFGTCGNSQWRDAFIAKYEALGIPYFNPQVPNWTPELAEVEAWHLANDEILLFPVTAETYGTGSLAETGFSVASALAGNTRRFVVAYIAPTVTDALTQANPVAAKESLRARALVRAHLAKQPSPNVYVVDSLEQMLETSLSLYAAAAMLEKARGTSARQQPLTQAAWQLLLANDLPPKTR